MPTASGVAGQATGGYTPDGQVSGARADADLAVGDAQSGAQGRVVAESGYQDPHAVEANAKLDAQGRVDDKLAPEYEAQADADHARSVAADPGREARYQAQGSVDSEVADRTPDSVRNAEATRSDAEYKASEARTIAGDPEAAAQERARAEAEERAEDKARGAGVPTSVNVSGSVSGGTDPEKK